MATGTDWRKPLLLSVALIAAGGSSAAAAPTAATTYAKRCAACHGQTGKGDGPTGQLLSTRPEPFSSGLKGRPDSWIDTVVTKGGPAVGLSAEMPAQPTLSSSQVNDLIKYIKGMGS